MADRYLILGAAFNGDGTSSAEATSNGGVGAWNQQTILTGTAPSFGTLSAGDIVHIRSLTSSGGDITLTYNVNTTFGNAAATNADPIVFAFDDGTIWPGVNGTVIIECTTASPMFSIASFNTFMHKDKSADKLSFDNRFAATNGTALVSLGIGARLVNASIDFTKVTFTSTGPRALGQSANGACFASNIRLKLGNRHGGAQISAAAFASFQIDGLDVVIPAGGVWAGGTATVFAVTGEGSRLVVNGGQIRGPGANSSARVFSLANFNNTGGFIFTGFSWPYDMNLTPSITNSNSFDNRIEALGCDGVSGTPRQMGAVKVQRAGLVDSRNDGNHPVLNAVFNDSNSTGWSWRVVPERANVNNILDVRCFKVTPNTAGAKKVTLEMLVRQSFLADNGGPVSKQNTWMSVTYIDAGTGQVVNVNTMDMIVGGNLDASTAAWSSTTWGSIACTKKKIELTTPTSVAQDTLMTVSFYTSATGSGPNDVFFLCPDPIVVDA